LRGNGPLFFGGRVEKKAFLPVTGGGGGLVLIADWRVYNTKVPLEKFSLRLHLKREIFKKVPPAGKEEVGGRAYVRTFFQGVNRSRVGVSIPSPNDLRGGGRGEQKGKQKKKTL